MRLVTMFSLCLLMGLGSCSTTKPGAKQSAIETESPEQRNRAAISLLNRIRQLPGVIVRNGVPVFTKTSSESTQPGAVEPLYIIDDYIVGNSFRAADELVESINVKKIEALTGPDTSFYGSRGGNGVIKITTYQ
ncbi:MAG: TonB-dependent receptor plug domain-containing protein [Flavobacteriaceae bacterium]|nr:TonB-dependent receptor plug domain-containing protein [Flavobacteriaceae bacterium]